MARGREPVDALAGALFRAAAPVLEQVDGDLTGQPVAWLVTDRRGQVVHRAGGGVDDALVEAMGARAVDAALQERRLSVVHGGELLDPRLARGVGVAAPVRDPASRRLVGALSLVTGADEYTPVLATVVRQAAQLTECQLADDPEQGSGRLLATYLDAAEQPAEPVFAIGPETLHAAPEAMSILGGIPHDALWASLTESLANEEAAVVTLSLAGGGTAVVRCDAVRDDGRLVGAVGDVRLRLPGVPRQGRVPEVPEYVGWSAAVRNAAVGLRASAADHLPACVSGEPGTGKRTMARVVVGRVFPGRNLLVLGAAEATPERVGDELARGLPVLVLHVESMSTEALTELVVTATSTGRSGWVVMTHATEAAAERPGRWPPGLRVVTLPPLRTRPEDIELVLPLMLRRRARGRELALTPQLVERLRREPWPTNLHGIDLLVTELARTTGRVLDVRDLPDEFDAMMRRRLTPMEWMTRHAILDALEASDGNKSRAAEALGISRASIYRKIKALGIELNGEPDEGAEG